MPRYQITAPDGREVVIEGERPPTQEDALKIFAQLPPKTEKKGIPQDTLGGKKKPAPSEVDKPRDAGGVLADIGMEGGGAAGGQLIGAIPALAIPTAGASIPIGGAIGGLVGNLASQKRRILAGEQKGYRAGEALSSMGTGAIPGASTGAAGARTLAREAIKQGAGGVAGRAVETVIDEGRLPSVTEVAITGSLPAVAGAAAQRMQAAGPATDATRRATLAAGREAGYVLPPSVVNPGFVTNTLESIGGKAAMGQEAAIRNQRITNQLAKEALGLPQNVDITETVLEGIRRNAAQPYETIGQMAARARTDLDTLLQSTTAASQHQTAANRAVPAVADRIRSLTTIAGADIQALRDARFRANQGFRHYERSADPDALTAARAAQAEADTLENAMEQAAVEAGTPEVVDQLRAARTRIAQTYDVERALNLGDANVSAPIIGRALDKDKPLTGPLATIGNFAEAFPAAVREGSKIPTPGVSALLPVGALLGAGGGYAAAGPAGALLGLAPFARGPVRSAVLSEPYQNFATRIPTAEPSPNRALATRVITQEAAQEIADEAQTKKEEKKPEPPKVEPPKKSAMVAPEVEEEDLPTLTPRQAKKAPVGTKFIGTNGLAYEKLSNGKIKELG